MKHHHPFIITIAKKFATTVRGLLRVRYKVSVKGSEALNSTSPILILPNHQALVDPIILFSQLYRYTTAIPVITSNFYDIPGLKSIFSNWGAVRVSDLEKGSRNVKVLDEISHSVSEGFRMEKNIVLYPSGQISGQGYEKIFNKQSAQKIVSEMPENVRVVGVRVTGLWGSMWSKAWSGNSPNFFSTLLKGILYTFANLIFFAPRRSVTVEFEDLTFLARKNANQGRREFNVFLEEFYNIHGEEAPHFLKHYFYSKKLKRKLPEKISGSITEVKAANLPVDLEAIPLEVLNKIKQIVASILEIDSEKINANSYLNLDLAADSLNLVEIVSEVENNFEAFSALQINEIKTVGDLCLVAMGQFSTESDLKPSYLEKSISQIGDIYIDPEKSILQQFIDTFTTNSNDYFSYDAMLGSTNRKTFLLKAAVISEIIKQKVEGKNVGIMLPALQSTTMLIIASYMAGKVPVMLNWTVGKKVLEHCLETAEVNVILSAGTFISKIEEQLPDSIKDKLLLLEKQVPNIGISTKLKGFVKSKFPKSLLPKIKIDDTAVILFTSGSEAMPKAVPLSHRNVVSDLHGVFKEIKLDNNQIFLSFLPPFHSFGFTVLSILPLVTGVKIAYTPNPTDAREVLKILKHTKANILLGTPGFLKLLLSEGTSYFFKSVRYAISGAEAMPPSVKEQFDKLTPHALLLEGYGITECAPVLTINPQEKQKLNSVGKFIPGVESIICDLDTGKTVKTGQAGMIYVKGNNIFQGYLGDVQSNPFEEIEGKTFYKTGDLGYLDEDGYLFITGRLKRFIKIAGEMISLPFIEKILLEKYGEEETQVLAIEGSDKITPPQIVLFTTRTIDLNETNDYLLRNGVAPIAKVKRIVQLDEIPVLGTGKTDYKVLKKLIENV